MFKTAISLAAFSAGIFAVFAASQGRGQSAEPGAGDAAKQLAEEVHSKGWIAFSARSENGDWDLFLCRPDGAGLRNLTRTPDYNEAAPQLSRNAERLLFRRLARDERIENNYYGTQGELVISKSDGTGAEVLGARGEYPWASWGPDGKQIACLSIKGISFVDVASRQVLRTLPRKGFFQQLAWSPDGKWLCGVSNSFGASWSIGRMSLASGEANAVSTVNCCTPDWFPDSRGIVFSNRPPGQKANKGYGWTELWTAGGGGQSRRLVYGEEGRHVYGGHVSPDGKYVLFTGNMQENGDPRAAGAPMGLIRLADAPIIVGQSTELRGRHPDVHDGPVLVLPNGWEPCWTYHEIGGER